MESAFDILGLPHRFDLSRTEIASAYRRAMLKAHPDIDSRTSEAESDPAATLNLAKQTLEAPLARAEHLCAVLHGPQIGREAPLPQDFLMEMMEIRESAESRIQTEGESARAAWRNWADERRAEKVQEISAAFARNESASTLRGIIARWRYIERMIEQLDPNYDVGQR